MSDITDFVKILELKRYERLTINRYGGHVCLVKHLKNPDLTGIKSPLDKQRSVELRNSGNQLEKFD